MLRYYVLWDNLKERKKGSFTTRKDKIAHMRSSDEITMRCKPILDRADIVSLVNKSSSPTAAYDMVMDATGDNEIAKAARWLGVLRRDYPGSYAEITHNTLCHVLTNTARKGKSKDEKGICS